MKDVVKVRWREVGLGKVCSLENGDRGKNYPGRRAFVAGGVPFINAGHVEDGRIAWDAMNFIPEERFRLLGSGKIRKGDILFCLRGSLGKFGIVDREGDGAIASSLVIIRTTEALDAKFLAMYLRSALAAKMVEKHAGGAAQPNLSAKNLGEFVIPLPPIEEQRRIVAILDEAFEGLARARAYAEANLRDVEELFSKAEAVSFGDVQQTKEATLGSLASFRNGLNYSRSSQGATVKIVGVGDFKDNYEVPLDQLSTVRIDGKLQENDRLKSGDVIAVRSNGNRELIGRTMLVPEMVEPVSHSGFTIRIRLHSDALLPDYLCSFMRTKAARAKLAAGGGGANISNLNQGLLSSVTIPVPEVGRQQEILGRLEMLRESTQVLKDKLRAKLSDIDDLRRALLQHAFAGELT